MALLSAVSSVAVIAGAVFIVFQLRQNARLIQATIQENKAIGSISLLERLTDESFARRRKQMHDIVKKYSAQNWEGFDDTLEDFEARNFAYMYELIGQLAREGLLDLGTVKNALQYLVVVDWDVFTPLNKHLMERYNLTANPWATSSGFPKKLGNTCARGNSSSGVRRRIESQASDDRRNAKIDQSRDRRTLTDEL